MTDHGTRARYSAGCRCTGCTEANRAYNRAYLDRLKRAAEETGQPMYVNRAHGRQETYNRGCRCDLCRKVEAARNQRKRARAKLGVIPNPRVYLTLPLEPLIERVAIHIGRPVDQISQYDFAQAVGVHQRTVCRWIKNGRIPERQSDRVAINLGWHPAAIWGVDWYIETYDKGEVA